MKRTVLTDQTASTMPEVPDLSDESNDDTKSAIAWKARADANRKLCEIKDVSRYQLPEDLERRLVNYADDDPVFADHVKRAHKFYNTLPEARGQDPWKIEVKMFDLDSGEFNKFGPYRRETIPTPDELRSENAFGKLRFVIHYFTPHKMVKGMKMRPGIMTVKSKTFDIAPPAYAPARAGAPLSQPITLPPQQMVDAFQSIFAQAQQMVLEGATLQMTMIANRQKIIDEGIEIGKLQKQNEVLTSQVGELTRLISAMQENAGPQEIESGNATVTIIQTLVDKFGPALMQKWGLAGDGSPEKSPIPSQK